MPYATMPTFEGNSLGVRRLSALGNAGHMLDGLGDFATDSYVQAAIYAGYNADDINTLVAGGATSTDLSNLINGNTTIQLLLSKLYPPDAATGTSSGGINPAVAPAPPPQPAPPTIPGTINFALPAVQVPAGSILSYTASWNNPSALASIYAGVVPKLASQLPSYGISVLQTNVTGYGLLGPSSIQLQLQSLGAHAQVSDVTSIVNSLLQALVGNTLFQNAPQMWLVSAGPITPAGGAASLGNQTMTQWFQSNWGWLAATVAAIVIVPVVIKKL